MRILFVADMRSPIALNWISYFLDSPHEVHLVSTYPAEAPDGAASFHVIPAAFSGAAAAPAGGGRMIRKLTSPRLRTLVRQWLGVWTLRSAAARLRTVITDVQPEIVHAMRIPYEGMIAALACRPLRGAARPPLLVSIWGNDFTLHAVSNPAMAANTRLAMRSADAIHADCRRDVRLAHEWGFPTAHPSTVLPGGGGIQTEIFFPPSQPPDSSRPLTVIQPRGLRAYVQNEAFFRAIPLVLNRHPGTTFICPAMAGENRAETLVRSLGLQQSVTLLPRLSRETLAGWFRKSDILVSPTTHDGTPNTLLEGLACGCFPVAGDIESIREWVRDGETGLLVDPTSPDSIAAGICRAIESPELRNAARAKNTATIRQRADYPVVMKQAEGFYRQLTNRN